MSYFADGERFFLTEGIARTVNDFPFGSDYILLSPEVTTFRNDSMQLSPPAKPFAVITSAAPSLYGPAGEENQRAIDEAMKHKMRCLLAVALDGGYDTLTLGAWGCGAFGHIATNLKKYFLLTRNKRTK